MEKQVRISDSIINYEVVHRNIKYPRLEFKTGRLLLILPKSYEDYDDIIEKHKEWIYKRNSEIRTALEKAQNKKLNLKRTDDEFRQLIYSIVENISNDLKININNIYFRKMKSKWGSCSSKKNLTINTLLRYLPSSLIEYVIFMKWFIWLKGNTTNAFGILYLINSIIITIKKKSSWNIGF